MLESEPKKPSSKAKKTKTTTKKTAARKTAAKKSATGKKVAKKKVAAKAPAKAPAQKAAPTATTTATTTAPRRTVSVEERRHMIAEAAYRKAYERQFRNGSPQQDWLDAEAEVDARLADTGAEIERGD